MIATGVITATRPIPTLLASLASFRDAGFRGDVYVFADCVVALPVGAARSIIKNNPKLGSFRNWVSALRTMYAVSREPWLMVCEDDISWARDSADALARDLPSLAASVAFRQMGALSLYCSRRVSQNVDPLPDGWHYEGLQLGRETWGAQCLLFSRAQAEKLLTDPRLADFLADDHWQNNVDAIVADCVWNAGRVIAYRIPCLVDHDLGDGNSSLGDRDHRPELRTNYFTGRP